MYKADWESALERMDAWWEGELVDRCVIAVTAPRTRPVPVKNPPVPDDVESKWLDVDFRLAQAEANMAATFYGGEAFPNFWCNLGPGVAASYLGARPVFAEDTVWFDRYPVIENWDEVSFKFAPDNPWWVKTRELTQRAAESASGKYFVGVTDLGGNLDIIASLRGAERLLYDLIDNPSEVERAVEGVFRVWSRCYDELDALIRTYMEGTSGWMNIWCRKRWYPLQSDFSAMISPQMVEQFVLPELQKQCRRLDYSIYHCDGPGQLPHVDLILSIPELTAFQWTPGYGNPPVDSEHWIPLYRRVQAAGKNLVLFKVPPKRVEFLLSELSPKGLYIYSECESEEEAKALLKDVARWTARSC